MSGTTLSRRVSEFAGVALFACALIWLISLASYNPADPVWFFSTGSDLPPANFAGRVGAFLAEVSFQLFGYSSYLIPLVLAISRQAGALEDTPDLITRGLAMDARTESVLKEVPALLADIVESASVEERTDPGLIKEKVRTELQRFFRHQTVRQDSVPLTVAFNLLAPER